ncbi:hypothetical protein B1R32_10346 [Abditibacterium utsteinense]|uniref:Uncharacterized protein n=1 Tax=Abditibacterium utsteinense TaxID=1960156 RepID=A0A2S8SVG6_9BACT|nr:hypothetical protein B1R32_10346 [Abditibacterium utsteinense]
MDTWPSFRLALVLNWNKHPLLRRATHPMKSKLSFNIAVGDLPYSKESSDDFKVRPLKNIALN